MAKRKQTRQSDDAPATKSKSAAQTTSIKKYVQQNVENRQWYVTAADCIKAGSIKFYTGFLDLDLNLMGGFPYGKMSLVSGADSSGKTTLMLCTVARMLRTCRQCFTPIVDFINYQSGEIRTACRCGKMQPMNGLYIDAEDRYDAVWAGKHGLPVNDADPLSEHLMLVKPNTGEMVADSVRKMIQDGILDFLVVDSYAAMFPEAREGRLAGQQMPGDSAKMIQNLLMTILHENMRDGGKTKRRCTVLGTQQYRANIGVMYGPKVMIPGGWYLRHGLTTHVAMMSPRANEGIDKKKVADASTHYVDFTGKIAKASLGGNENNQAHWRLYTKAYSSYQSGESDEPKRVLEALNALKMAGKDGDGYHILGLPFATINDMMDAVRKNETFSLVARYVLLYNYLPADSRSYLDMERFNYDPFYELVLDAPEQGDGEEKAISRFRLVARDSVGGGTKPRDRRNNKTANEELAKINPPDATASAG